MSPLLGSPNSILLRWTRGTFFSGEDGWVPRRLGTKGTGVTEQKGDCSMCWQEEVAFSTALLRGRFQGHKALRAFSAFPEDETYDLPRSWRWKAPLHSGDWCSHRWKWLFPQILHHRHSWLSEFNNNAPPPPTKWLLSKFMMFQLLTVINCYSHCITIWRAIVQGKASRTSRSSAHFSEREKAGVLAGGSLIHLAICCCSVAQLCLTLHKPVDCNMPGFPVLH